MRRPAARRPILTLVSLFVVCVGVFLATARWPRADGLLIGSDGVLYYCYVHSLVMDGDLDLANEYQHFSQFPGFGHIPPPTPVGRLPNRVPIGLGIVWVPFFLAGHAVAWLLGYSLDGYSTIHQAAVCLGSMTYGFIGLLLSYRLCREYTDAASALSAVVLLWLASNVIYYQVAEPSMSHMASLGAVAALLAWWRLGSRRAPLLYWGVLGALGGLAALIRPQDGLFLVLPALQWCREAVRLMPRGSQRIWAHLRCGALMLVAALAVYAIQLWAWWTIYGSIVDSGYAYAGAHQFAWRHPHGLEVLFSLRHGLFTWHPVFAVAAVGLLWRALRDPDAVLMLVAFALQVYVVAAWDVWWQGDAFGGRMFISCVPIFAVGLAQVVQRLRRIHGSLVFIPGVALILWNAAFFIQYRFGFIPMSQAITLQQLVWDKLRLPLEVWRRLAAR